ncbi:DUF2997 domain-containing protein [Sphingomonas swuensis]|uniref:DUF2997 domain-containing protein n=1 Tax=Sphingomonas swuensis TaxID=977800 RepID=UPI0031D4B54F
MAKAVLGHIGIAGKGVSRAICARHSPFQLFLVRSGSDFQLVIESDDRSALADHERVEALEAAFRFAYLAVAAERTLCASLDDGGVPWTMEEQPDGMVIRFGPDLARRVILRSVGDHVEEEVAGVLGGRCAELTAELEDLLASATAELLTEWKPSYHETIDDEVVQVLRLGA